MGLILNIETSTTVCSVNIAKDGVRLFGRETIEQNAHSKILTVYIEELFEESKFTAKDFDAVAVSKGPGSYTGLRIGVSVAKGLCYGSDIPLISVNTLQSMVVGAKQKSASDEKDVLYAPMIDARRMEVYTALFNNDFELINEISAKIIDEDSYNDVSGNNTIYFFGDGAMKCKDTIKYAEAVFFKDLHPSADYMIPFSEKAFSEQLFEDVAYFEPYYLKDFVATVPTKNIYG